MFPQRCIPRLFPTLQNSTEFDWSYYTEKNDKSALASTHGVFWPRGKMLGGCSANNAMLYVRGNDRDYNQWEELGNPGWGWKDALEYFKKSEGNKAMVGEESGIDPQYHGSNGPLKVSVYNYDLISKFLVHESAFELGFKELADVNGEEYIGYTSAHGTVWKGERWSVAKAFLISTKHRENLNIIKHAHVTRVNINSDGVAESVAFDIKGKSYKAVAKKEIILSAGAVNTPQLLMLSGIGPAEQLTKHNIPVIKDLKVGGNLQDHLIVPFYVPFNKGRIAKPEPNYYQDAMFNYAMTGEGPLSTLPGIDILGFLNTANKSDPYPDIEMHHLFVQNNDPNYIPQLKLWGYDDALLEQFRKTNRVEDIYTFMPALLNPKSIGRIELRSADPFDPPLIYPNYLEEQDDVDTFVRAMKFIQTFFTTDMMKTHNGRPMKLNLPACNVHEFDTDEYWVCYVRHMTTTLYHPVGTAKMGPDTDPDAVVDAVLRVKGIKGLRVADASIMPNIVSGNTNAATVMIGEQAADFIKEAWPFDEIEDNDEPTK